MSAFLSRLVKRGIGTRSAEIAPARSPYFPPARSSGSSSLDARGDVIFQPTDPSQSPREIRSDAKDVISHVPTIQAAAEFARPTTSSALQQSVAELRPTIISPLTPRPHEKRLPDNLPAEIQAELPPKLRSTELSPPVDESSRVIVGVTPPDFYLGSGYRVTAPDAISENADSDAVRTETKNQASVTAVEPRTQTVATRPATPNEDFFRDREISIQRPEEHVREQGLEITGQTQFSAGRQRSVLEGPRTASGETVTEVRIGRIEVRMNSAPAAAAAPVPSRRGPLGFAGYEVVRRYLTRSRI